jgi:cold shock CspA family protein
MNLAVLLRATDCYNATLAGNSDCEIHLSYGEEEMNAVDAEGSTQDERLDPTTGTTIDQVVSSKNNDDLCLGVIQEYNAKGPWGRIIMEDGTDAWFNEEIAFKGGERIPEGERIEFRIRYQEKVQAWQALSIRRCEDVDTGGTNNDSPTSSDLESSDAGDVSGPGAGEGGPVMRGKVSNYNLEKGFGWITPEGVAQPSVFVHHTQIVGDGFRYLLVDEPVEFEVVENTQKDRLEAANVRPPEGRKKGKVEKFDHAKGFGFIKPDDGTEDIFFHHSSILAYTKTGRLTAEEDEVVWFDVQLSKDGRSKAVRVKRQDSRPPLLRFADMGKEEDWLSALAAKAEKESWQHSVRPNKYTKFPILKSYLMYTFARLEQEDLEAVGKKIAMGRDGNRPVACFNTGLVTTNQEEILALFSSKPSSGDGRNWKLEGFHAISDHKLLGKFDTFPPELVNYFDDPSVLLYDRRRELYIDIDHVLDDNISRFPKELQDQKFLARQSLVAAKAQTQQRVYRNYKTAVPQFYRGEVQLLLPLCLMEPGVADLALVVSTKEGQYRGDTILTLDMAYSNARLLCRPDSDWLKP